jgi:hypothetical protein
MPAQSQVIRHAREDVALQGHAKVAPTTDVLARLRHVAASQIQHP